MSDGRPANGASGREVKGSIAKMVLSYVRRALGPDAAEQVLTLAGQSEAAADLRQPGSWTTSAGTLAIAEAAAAVCGDPDIGRRTGEELMRVMHERGTPDFVRAAGSMEAALIQTTNSGTKMSNGRTIALAEMGECEATIVAEYLDPAHAHPFWCGQAAGFYGLVPSVFGHVGVITEPECRCRGDDRCVYRRRWTPTTT